MTHRVTIEIKALTEVSAQERARFFEVFNESISFENLKFLAERCKKLSNEEINNKIKRAKPFI